MKGTTSKPILTDSNFEAFNGLMLEINAKLQINYTRLGRLCYLGQITTPDVIFTQDSLKEEIKRLLTMRQAVAKNMKLPENTNDIMFLEPYTESVPDSEPTLKFRLPQEAYFENDSFCLRLAYARLGKLCYYDKKSLPDEPLTQNELKDLISECHEIDSRHHSDKYSPT